MQPPFFVKWNNMVHMWFNLEKIMFIPIKIDDKKNAVLL